MSRYRPPASELDEKKFGQAILENVLDWINDWYEIHEVFEDDNIKAWLKDHAEEYGFVEASNE